MNTQSNGSANADISYRPMQLIKKVIDGLDPTEEDAAVMKTFSREEHKIFQQLLLSELATALVEFKDVLSKMEEGLTKKTNKLG